MIRIAIVALLALSLAACASTGAGATAGTSKTVKPYPLDTCLVTGSALGSMGDPVTAVHGGQEVKFCCEACIAEFEANPDAFLKKLESK